MDPRKCAKAVLYSLNAVFWVVGTLCVGFGAWAIATGTNVTTVDQSFMIGVICFGGVLYLVGFLGCCGTLNENGCLLKMFCSLSVLVILGEVGLVMVAFLLQDDIESYREKTWRGLGDSIRIYVQRELICCPFVHSFSENERLLKSFQDASCYRDGRSRNETGVLTVTLEDLQPTDCQTAITQWLTDHMVVLIVVGVLFLCLQVVSLIYVYLLICSKESVDISDSSPKQDSTRKHRRWAAVSNRVVPLELQHLDGDSYMQRQTTGGDSALQRRPVHEQK